MLDNRCKGPLHRFRRGALEAAARAGVDVLPIFLLADPPTLKKTDRWYNVQSKTTRFEVQFLPRIDAAEAQDSRAVCASVKEQIQSRLEAAAPPRDPTDAVAAPSRG